MCLGAPHSFWSWTPVAHLSCLNGLEPWELSQPGQIQEVHVSLFPQFVIIFPFLPPHLAQWGERASHEQRLCPRCSAVALGSAGT